MRGIPTFKPAKVNSNRLFTAGDKVNPPGDTLLLRNSPDGAARQSPAYAGEGTLGHAEDAEEKQEMLAKKTSRYTKVLKFGLCCAVVFQPILQCFIYPSLPAATHGAE